MMLRVSARFLPHAADFARVDNIGNHVYTGVSTPAHLSNVVNDVQKNAKTECVNASFVQTASLEPDLSLRNDLPSSNVDQSGSASFSSSLGVKALPQQLEDHLPLRTICQITCLSG